MASRLRHYSVRSFHRILSFTHISPLHVSIRPTLDTPVLVCLISTYIYQGIDENELKERKSLIVSMHLNIKSNNVRKGKQEGNEKDEDITKDERLCIWMRRVNEE